MNIYFRFNNYVLRFSSLLNDEVKLFRLKR